MTYNYKCCLCGIDAVIVKPMSESDRVEHCEICESELTRVFTSGSIITGDGFKK